MDVFRNQLISTWQRNQKANLQIIETIQDENLNLPMIGGRSTIAHQFAHVHTIRFYNVEKLNKKAVKGLQKLSSKDELNAEILKSNLSDSESAITELIQVAPSLEKIKGYKNGYFGFIAYLINHESHHRGKILLTLKNSGFPFAKEFKFDLWNWK